MGTTKIKQEPKEEKEIKKTTKVAKKTKKEKKTAKAIANAAKPETILETTTTEEVVAEATPIAEETEAKKVKKERSKKYQHLRSQVDKTKLYSLEQAVELVKKLSSKKHNQITADVNYRDTGFQTQIQFPHSTGKSLKVAIATEELLADVQNGKINFDVLLATPQLMPKLVRLAKVLGPKGLMPNPKNQTVTTDPEKRKLELEGGKITIKTEKKAPLMHVSIGKTAQPDLELVENLKTLIKIINPHKITRLTISSTMSPGVKVDFEKEIV
jgi:large subunit ribosomal protein L1